MTVAAVSAAVQAELAVREVQRRGVRRLVDVTHEAPVARHFDLVARDVQLDAIPAALVDIVEVDALRQSTLHRLETILGAVVIQHAVARLLRVWRTTPRVSVVGRRWSEARDGLLHVEHRTNAGAARICRFHQERHNSLQSQSHVSIVTTTITIVIVSPLLM